MATSRLRGGTPFITAPAIFMVPPVMLSNPAIDRSKVDLPQPEGPTRATNWPLGMTRSMFLSAWKLP